MKKILLSLSSFLIPISLWAASTSTTSGTTACASGFSANFQGLMAGFLCIVGNYIIPILFALAFLYFLWNIANTIRKASNPKEVENARKTLIISVIALFVMVSVWGLVNILTSTFGVGGSFIPQIRTLK